MKLENWYLTYTPTDLYKAPETLVKLAGNVYGSPNFADGTFIYTSRIVDVKNELVYTASGSVYELGAASPEYEKEFPNARERLLHPEKRNADNA